jgi:orotate phosphoribosyltransferase
MQNSELLDIFQQLGVVTSGHFVLSSGRHSNEYWEKFRLLEWPRVTEQLCSQIASRHKQNGIEAVIGPTTGGALLAQEVARQLSTRCLLAESAPMGGRELRRGFLLHASERVLIVDDVLTTGLSLRETSSAIERFQPETVGIEVLIDRSGGDAIAQFGVPCYALLTVSADTYSSVECPMCREGIPIVKPGTRDI